MSGQADPMIAMIIDIIDQKLCDLTKCNGWIAFDDQGGWIACSSCNYGGAIKPAPISDWE